jgi:hypothetical protein
MLKTSDSSLEAVASIRADGVEVEPIGLSWIDGRWAISG